MAETARLNLIVDASGAERALTSFEAKAKSVGAKARGAFDNLKDSVFSLKGAFAGLIGAIGARSVFNTIASFEKMEASLRTVTGSTEAAANAMSVLQNFAASTPFQITELTDAFIKLQALGLSPSEEALRSYGNTASALGKSLNQMIEAVADASTGEFERLKEFGIKASSQGNQVSFTFQGVTKTVGKNSKEIQDYLLAIGNTQFAGAMEKQMDTLSGRVSNFQDQLTTTIVGLGKAGLTDVLKKLLDSAIAAITFVGKKVALLPLYFKAAFATIDKGILDVQLSFEVMGEAISFAWEKSLAFVKEEFASFLRDISGVMARIPGFGDQAMQIDNYAASLEKAAAQVGTLDARLAPIVANYERQKQVIDDVMESEFKLQAEREAIAAKAALPAGGAPGQGAGGPDELDRLLDQAIAQEEELKRQSEFNAEKLAMQQAYWDELYNLETGSQKAIFDFTAALRTNDLQGVIQNGAAALANVARTNKTAFEMQKRLALANAAVTLPSAVIKSYENAGGYPAGIIPAGLMLAAGLQQINAIKSSTFQGGAGSPPAVGSAGAGGAGGTAAGLPPGAATPAAAAATPAAPPKQAVTVVVQGGLYSDQDMRNFLERMNEVGEDIGSNIVLVPA